MLSHLQDPVVEQSDAEVEAALDDIPVLSFYEATEADAKSYRGAVEALKAAPPEPYTPQSQAMLRLTRQSARRLAMQYAWARLSDTGLPRRERRRIWHTFKFSDLARALVAGQAALPGAPQPSEGDTPSPR